jgi:hypothetical protein
MLKGVNIKKYFVFYIFSDEYFTFLIRKIEIFIINK